MATAVYLLTLSFLLSSLAVNSIQACGGNFTSISGIIQSPNYPSNYSNDENCVYLITAPDNHRITLTFTNFDLELSTACVYDYMEVRDGDNDKSPRLGRYCGQTLPNRTRTFGHQMWIKFVSDGSDSGKGFRITYTAAVLPDAFLLISSSASDSPLGKIFYMEPETSTNYAIPMSDQLYNPIAVDYDPVNKTIYWTEVGIVNRVRASSLSGSGVRTLKDAGEGSILDGLAVDAKSRLIFYTDAGKDEIVMMTMNTLVYKTVINSNLDRPRAIVLNTADGVMFWTDWGTPAKIERASYDGTNRQILIMDAIGLINALALDVPNNRLYWVDALTDKVEVVDMEGKGRRVLFNTPDSFNGHFFGLALYEDVLYTTNWGQAGIKTRNSSLLSMHLTSGEIRQIGSVNGTRLNDIHAYSEVSFDTSPNGCSNNNGGCSIFCIPLPGNSSKCTCPDGQTLTSDQKTCVDGSAKAVTETTIRTTDNTTPRHADVNVSTSDPMPFDTNGQRKMALTCDPSTALTALSYQWSVRCSRQVGNTCIFAPQPPEDDGKTVTCTVTTPNGQVHTGAVEIELNYPPQQVPKIETLKDGQRLSMICSVTGGKPLVKAVNFSCDGHPDTSHGINTQSEVYSVLRIHSLQPEDDGSRCVCTAQWKNKDWYQLSAVTTLRLQGQQSSNADTSKQTPDITTIITGVSAGGLWLILVLTVCIVYTVKRKRTRNMNKKKPRRGQHPEEHPYRVLYADRNSQAFPNGAVMITNGQDMERCGSGIYDLAEENEGNSVYTTIEETDEQMSVKDYYLTPVEHHQQPVPGNQHSGQLTSPADDYLHPCNDEQNTCSLFENLTPTEHQQPVPGDQHSGQLTSPADDYLHPCNDEQNTCSLFENLTPTEHQQQPVPGDQHSGQLTSPADDYLHPCNDEQNTCSLFENLTPTEHQQQPVPGDQHSGQLTSPADDYLHPCHDE